MVLKNKNYKNHLINISLKKGKKTKIEKIYKNLYIVLKKKLKKHPQLIVNKVIENIMPKVEIKKVSRYMSVPVYIKPLKQIKTSIKWLTPKLHLKELTKEFLGVWNNDSKSNVLNEKKNYIN